MLLGAEVRLSRSTQKHIGSVDPYALENPRPEGAEYSLTESATSPLHAEPEQPPRLLTILEGPVWRILRRPACKHIDDRGTFVSLLLFHRAVEFTHRDEASD